MVISVGEYAIWLIRARIIAEKENNKRKLEFIKKEVTRLIKCIPYGWIVPVSFSEGGG